MTKRQKFVFISGDLSRLTSEQQQQYVLDACEFLQVPPELGVVTLQLMDVGDGARQLLLYVKRGATDIIRDRRKINIDKLEPFNGDGYVGWIATGHDATGRQEIAVGTVSTRGLSGQAIANAVMTSQTKSMRRLTLQFAGGGFLDETEINEKTTNIASALQPLATIAQPTVAPSSEAGKDITPASQPAPTPLATEPLSVVSPDTNAMNHGRGSLAAVSAAEEPRKKRRKKVVSLDTPELSQSEIMQAELEPLPASQGVPDNRLASQAISAVIPPEKVSEVPQTSAIPIIQGTPVTKERETEFRKKLSTYVNDILPKAGFLQSDKFGSRNAKIGAFVKLMFPDANTRALTLEQWTEFFNFMENKIQTVGAEALVIEINTKIGEI